MQTVSNIRPIQSANNSTSIGNRSNRVGQSTPATHGESPHPIERAVSPQKKLELLKQRNSLQTQIPEGQTTYESKPGEFNPDSFFPGTTNNTLDPQTNSYFDFDQLGKLSLDPHDLPLNIAPTEVNPDSINQQSTFGDLPGITPGIDSLDQANKPNKGQYETDGRSIEAGTNDSPAQVSATASIKDSDRSPSRPIDITAPENIVPADPKSVDEAWSTSYKLAQSQIGQQPASRQLLNTIFARRSINRAS